MVARIPNNSAGQLELRDIFVKTLEDLRPILRTVFILRDVEGLTIVTIHRQSAALR